MKNEAGGSRYLLQIRILVRTCICLRACACVCSCTFCKASFTLNVDVLVSDTGCFLQVEKNL